MAGHTPRPHPAQARSMAQYLLNIYSIKVYFPNWNTPGSDVTQSPEFIMTRGLWQQTKQIFASFRRDVYHQGCDTFLLPGPLAAESEL